MSLPHRRRRLSRLRRRALQCAFVALPLLYASYAIHGVRTWSENESKHAQKKRTYGASLLQLVGAGAHETASAAENTSEDHQPRGRQVAVGVKSATLLRGFEHDLGILILTCNRQSALQALLETLAHADGIYSKFVYVSIDCNPGPLLNLTLWAARGVNIRIMDSQQRNIVETGTAKVRRDERVTRHWLYAVQTVLLQHEYVLYLEEDHLVHPSILHDADALLLMQPTRCAECFAVQLGCHRDCWGMASEITTASEIARMEPGNMGVVYARETWQRFLQHMDEYCSIYGSWDINLHHVLSMHAQNNQALALTFLKSRVIHNSGCTSDRNNNGHAQCDDTVLQQDRARLVAQDMSMQPTLVDRGTAQMPAMTIKNTRAIRADEDTKKRCMQSIQTVSLSSRHLAIQAVQLTLQIFIPVSRIRMRMLCSLLDSLQTFQVKHRNLFDMYVFLVQAGNVTSQTNAFWNHMMSTQGMLETCKSVDNKPTKGAWNVSLTVMSSLPTKTPFPDVLQGAKPTSTQHATPERMLQTWDYIQILKYAFTRRSDAEYTLVLEDDAELCPDFFATLHAVLQRPHSSVVVDQDLPVFVGGFGGSALGYPTAATAGLARFLQKRIRDSNLDMLISKGLDAKSKWFAPVGHISNVEEHAQDIWIPVRSCVYKPSVFLVLHRGGRESNFGTRHKENAEIRCGSADEPRFFVHKFSESLREAKLYRSCN